MNVFQLVKKLLSETRWIPKNEQEASAKVLALQEKYRSVFLSPVGQEVLEHLADVGFLCKPTYDADEKVMWMNEGQRRLVLSIIRMIEKDKRNLAEQINKGKINEND